MVCPRCAQWNLSPLEERWEAIEAGERLYRDTRRRVSTEHVGMAKLRDGTELIRIGEPLRPEFAAWRYASRFRSRRFRRVALWTATAGVLGAAAAAQWAGLGLAGVALNLGFQVANSRHMRWFHRKVIALGEDDRGPFALTRSHLASVKLLWEPEAPGGWAIEMPYSRGPAELGKYTPSLFGFDGRTRIDGSNAIETLRIAMPAVNRSGGSARSVADAAALLDETPDLEALLRARAARTIRSDRDSHVAFAPPAVRIALEMAAHEDLEREAMRGELAALEAAWRDAEVIAAIADDLTLPDQLRRRLGRLRDR